MFPFLWNKSFPQPKTNEKNYSVSWKHFSSTFAHFKCTIKLFKHRRNTRKLRMSYIISTWIHEIISVIFKVTNGIWRNRKTYPSKTRVIWWFLRFTIIISILTLCGIDRYDNVYERKHWIWTHIRKATTISEAAIIITNERKNRIWK